MQKRHFKKEFFAVLLAFFRWFFLPLLLLFTLILFLLQNYYPETKQYIFGYYLDFIKPIAKSVNRPVLWYQETSEWIGSWLNLRQENQRLLAENKELRSYYAIALSQKSKIERLEKLVRKIPDLPFDYQSVAFLRLDHTDFMQTVLLEAGSDQGLQLGQVGLIDGMLAGRIVALGKYSARFLLLSDIAMRVPAKIKGKEDIALIVAGNNDGFLKFKYMPEGFEPEIGAVILTSGQGGIYPRDLPIGKVVKNRKGVLCVQPYATLNSQQYIQLISPLPKKIN